jgi:LmbE family N-acetylglucosaminyl deacetylase
LVVVEVHGQPQRVVVLSPHPDDAVFSAWNVLQGARQVVVITIFAGIPEPGFVTPLDRGHGASESAAWANRRRVEDSQALTEAGCDVVHADLLDLQYRVHAQPRLRAEVEADPRRLLSSARREPTIRVPPGEIDAAIGALIDPSSIVYAPAGVGGHPDHEDVAAYAVGLTGRIHQVRFYADSPYFLRHGLPSWWTTTPNLEADDAIEAAFAKLGLGSRRIERISTRLSDDAVAAKMATMREYVTEFEPVDADFGGIASDSELMRHETYWIVQ